MSSNPFAALFEDVDQASDPMLAEAQLSDVMFAPLSPPQAEDALPGARPAASSPAPAASPTNGAHASGPVRETIAPIKRTRSVAMAGGKAIQQALIVRTQKDGTPDTNELMELNDLLASGWRVITASAFQPPDGAGHSAMLVVVEQEAPK